jgi:hypothetical protein
MRNPGKDSIAGLRGMKAGDPKLELSVEKFIPDLFPLCRPVETPRMSTVGGHRLQQCGTLSTAR